MRTYYYFSNRKFKYVQIRNFIPKFLLVLLLLSLTIASAFSGLYLTLNEQAAEVYNPQSLINENSRIESKLLQLADGIRSLNNNLIETSSENEYLRLACNLDPLSISESKFGVGGNQFTENELIAFNLQQNEDVIIEIKNDIENIQTRLFLEKNSSTDIENRLISNKKYFSSIPAIIPTFGVMNDRFGMRRHPILGIRKMHTGIDIRNNVGTPVFAPGDGKVLFVGYKGGYGLAVEIDHGFGITTLFAHLSKSLVEVGKNVTRGEKVALSGRSGKLVTGPHLHYEVRLNGIPQNPANYILSDSNYPLAN